ncbi:MAG: hypothetical protein AAGA64_04690 [Bacteroidota bacterium]
MKKFIYGLSALILGSIAFIACDDEEFGALQSVPPSASAVNPGGIKLGSEAELQAAGADGVISPLTQGTLTLLDREFNVLATTTDAMTGQADTISMDAMTSGIAALDTGTYNLIAVTVDSEGNTSLPDTTSFEVFDLPFDANYATMYMLGQFTNWGGPAEERSQWEFELIAANTWFLDSTEIDGEWKLSVGPDFDMGGTIENEDWGDTDCDGVLEPKSATGNVGNTQPDCVSPGVYNITFNDETFNYALEEVILLESNLDDLFVLGSFNNFEGTDFRFTLVDDNSWRIEGVPLNAGEKLKFSEKADFSGNSYGDNEADGTADLFGSNIMVMETGNYTLSFNDADLSYTLTRTGPLANNAEMYILGDFNGWGGTDNQMNLIDNFTWQAEEVTLVASNEFKFANTSDFSGTDWEDQECDGIAQNDGVGNIICGFEGTFTITFNDETLVYTVVD